MPWVDRRGRLEKLGMPAQQPSNITITFRPTAPCHIKVPWHTFTIMQPSEGFAICRHDDASRRRGPRTQHLGREYVNVATNSVFWIPSHNVELYHGDVFWFSDLEVYIRPCLLDSLTPMSVDNVELAPMQSALLVEGTRVSLGMDINDPFCQWEVESIKYGEPVYIRPPSFLAVALWWIVVYALSLSVMLGMLVLGWWDV
ncbi:hypothetical protein IWX90DRAFT_486949 [Phyllosticta citrichinensis]|uniref:Uncharacterized protein n=1 Tax=Phyllosticta citrichinensis TaxID=1130410 RepID=A0ABR1XVA8_9PEZI